DVLMAMIAHLITHPSADGSAWFFADKFLDDRGLMPITKKDTPDGRERRAGHREEVLAEVARSVGRIGNIWIIISQHIDTNERIRGQGQKDGTTGKAKRPPRKRIEYTHRGLLISIDETWSQRELDMQDQGQIIGWKIRAGSWLKTFLEAPNRQVAYLCQKIIQ